MVRLFLLSLIICAGSIFNSLSAQNYEKVWFDQSDSQYGFYTVIKPAGPRIMGAVVLFGEYGADAVGLLSETKIQNVAFVNDLVTICIPTGKHLFLDDAHLKIIKNILNEVAKTYGIKHDRFAIGGFSLGGTIALRYTELCYEHPEEFEIQPKAVFTGDSPTDLLGLYESSKKELSAKTKGWWLAETQMIIDSLDKQLGVLPASMTNYKKVSPFINKDSLPGNEKWLATVPYRTYHDVDVEWALKYRQRSIYESNMLNASELIRRLEDEGNMQAEFVASKIPGRRNNGQMHPHSWNIIDEIDLIYWVKEKLNVYPGDISKKYTYSVEGWQKEIIIFPFDFAPEIPYKGYEDLRFAPGWGKKESDEKWTYTIVWWLDNAYSFDEKIIKSDLENYFTGINHRRAVADKDDMHLFSSAKAEVSKSATAPGDLATYSASMHIYDAQVTKKPGELYLKIHVKSCSDKEKTILLFEVSAFPQTQPVWKKLDKINEEFKCVHQ